MNDANRHDHGRSRTDGRGTHPIYRTPGLDFIAHPASGKSIAACKLPSEGELVLWRLRADWQAVSTMNPHAWASPDEHRKARYFRSSALARRYLIGRAALRRMLSGMLQCPGEHVEFADDAEGRLLVVRPMPASPIHIHTAHAGIWILIGIGTGPFRMESTLSPSKAQPTERDAAQPLCTQAWQSAISALGGPAIDTPFSVVAFGASSLVAFPDGTRYQTLDLPMPGELRATVVLAAPVWTVHAFGWKK